jgi:hypothetical protein
MRSRGCVNVDPHAISIDQGHVLNWLLGSPLVECFCEGQSFHPQDRCIVLIIGDRFGNPFAFC